MPPPGRRPFVACVGCLACSVFLACFAARTARAEDTKTPSQETPSKQADATDDFSVDAFAFAIGGAMTPPPTLSGFHTPDSRQYPGLDGVTSTTSMGGASSSNGAGGIDLHVGLHSNARVGVDIPIVGFRYVFLGHNTTALSDAAGNHASLDLFTSSGAVSLFGLGAHARIGPVVLRAAIRPVLEWSVGSGTVTEGFVSSDVSSYASFAVGFDADLQACALVVDHTVGICATASPRMWRTIDGEGGANNGIFFGLGIGYWGGPHE